MLRKMNVISKEAFIPRRIKNADKFTYKKVLIIAGAKGMAGAAYFAAYAAYKTGAGLVKILTVEENRQIIQTLLPEALISCYSNEKFDVSLVNKELNWSDHLVIGPGLGRDEYAFELVAEVIKDYKKPMVIDADALYVLAMKKDLSAFLSSNMLLTPHMIEMSRLIDKDTTYINEHMEKVAKDYSQKNNTNIILKAYKSIIAGVDKSVYISDSGSAAMAKGGSGDVLTGIIAGFIALGFDIIKAARYACFIHGLSGTLASKIKGEHGVLARDIVDFIPEAMKEYMLS